MNDASRQNKQAWEYNAYEFWVRQSGTPQEKARQILADPRRQLRFHADCFPGFEGLRVANVCGSCGKRAVPLALLGADVTVFDISEDNRRYALELAAAAGTGIRYVVGDVLEADLAQHGGAYDVAYMEGGILHYFHDLSAFMAMMSALLKPGGLLICSDFHPLTKVLDVLHFEQPARGYFSTEVFEAEMPHARFYSEAERRRFPRCSLRKYTLSEIINAAIGADLVITRFDEHPAWTDPDLPGEFTLLARKPL